MRRSGVLAFVATLLMSSASAQTSGGTTTTISRSLAASTTYVPTNTWTIPAGSCSAGMGPAAATATAGGTGGVFQDKFGGYWETECDYVYAGSTLYDGTYEGTNGQGIYACYNGCANRPGCTGFSFYGTTTGPATGGGRCLYETHL